MVEVMGSVEGNIELLLVGDFPDPDFEMEIRKAANDRIILTGRVPYDQVFEYLEKADIGLILLHPIPNSVTAFSRNNKIFEYMACSVPTVCTDLPLLRDVMPEKTGSFVPIDSPSCIASAIQQYQKNVPEARRRGVLAGKIVSRRYTWEIFCQNMLRWLNSIAK